MSSEVRIGIIGVGNMGGLHADYMKDVKNCRLTAVCDMNPEKLAKVAAKTGAETFADSAALIRSGKVDAVLIATPHYDHTPIAIDALENGLHVLVEKPVAAHKADALRMIEAAKKRPDLRFAVMFNQRTIPIHQKIKDLLQKGELGEIRRVNWIITNWYRTQSYYNSGGWRATWRGEGGGVLLNQCPHQLDLFQWFFGMPIQVRAFCELGKWHDIEVEDDVTAYLKFPSGATAVFISSTGDAPGSNRLEITCDRGRLIYEDDKLLFTRTEEPVSSHLKTCKDGFSTPPTWKVEIPVSPCNFGQHQRVTESFVAAVLDPKLPLLAEGAEGVNSLELGNSMLYSSMTGQTVDLPLDAARYEAMLRGLAEKSKFVKTADASAGAGGFGNSFKN